jgi:hypothetical protein
MMKMAEIGEREQKEMQAVGQLIVDMVGVEAEKRGIEDLNYVLNVLVSVAAHYISGIGDEDIRLQVYRYFGEQLRLHIERNVDTGLHAMVATTVVPSSKKIN